MYYAKYNKSSNDSVTGQTSEQEILISDKEGWFKTIKG